MTILVLSFDFDGCLYNREYLETRDIITANTNLLNSINQQCKEKNYSKSIIVIGSNRQSYQVDKINRQNNGTESCFNSIQEINKAIPNTSLDTFLLADIYGDLPFGTSFKLAIDQLNNPDKKLNHADYEFDENKVNLIYAQMHKVALENPGEEIVFNFYDDRPDIIAALAYFFNDLNPDLIPENVTLNLNQYNQQIFGLKHCIKGEGFIDANFKQTVKDITTNTKQLWGCGSNGERRAAYDLDVTKLTNRTEYNLDKEFKENGIVIEVIDKLSLDGFSKEQTDDLLVLYKFYLDNKKKTGPSYDANYYASLDSFFGKSLEIRLSDKPAKEQAKEIIDTAHKEFKHRHAQERLIADILMVVSVLFGGLGAFIMIGRACISDTVFFSSAPTDREKYLTNKLMSCEQLDDLSFNSSLFQKAQSI
ncbi:MAG: hypothetical protein H0U57_03970 [Tatlockia sp.]|nr:hypothetical protein [Tatlockia sp.]